MTVYQNARFQTRKILIGLVISWELIEQVAF